MTDGLPGDERLPLVSVVTPVFNGAKYLEACIESVVGQTYDRWDYTIVDNCSTDRSLEIAEQYAGKHPRIRVIRNTEFVGPVENHNRAFRAISAEAKYCKLLPADDWIYPDFLFKLVELAERNPSVGVVSCYAANVHGVRPVKLPLDRDVFRGREAARLTLLGEAEFFWTPSTNIYRAAVVRASDPFYPGSAPSTDLEACLSCLRQSDLGFVHQILTYERIHDEATSAKVRQLNSQLLDRLRVLIEFGPEFLTAEERDRRLDEQLAECFNELAVGCFNFRDREFWRVYKSGLNELGYSMYSLRLARAIASKFFDLALNPKATTEKIVRRVKDKQPGARPA